MIYNNKMHLLQKQQITYSDSVWVINNYVIKNEAFENGLFWN